MAEMQSTTIAVTGATGRLGGRIARRLADRGIPQRLAVRTPARAPELPGPPVGCSYDRPEQVRDALTGSETVVMVSGSETPDRVEQHRTFIDAAAAAGVTRLVYISFAGASPTATFTLARDHAATEEHLHASSLTTIVLRDNFYLDFLPELVETDGVIRGPAGDGRVAAVAQDDIADAAAAVLADPAPHDGRTYRLTGREALTLAEAAEIIGRHQGRPSPSTTRPSTRPTAPAPGRLRTGSSTPGVSTYTAVAAGELAEITDDIPTLAGHPALTLDDLLGRS